MPKTVSTPSRTSAPTIASPVLFVSLTRAGYGLRDGDRVPACDLLPHEREQAPSVVDGVLQRIEPADEQRGDADVDVVQQRLCDGLRGSDERGGVAVGADGLGDRRPQRAVV